MTQNANGLNAINSTPNAITSTAGVQNALSSIGQNPITPATTNANSGSSNSTPGPSTKAQSTMANFNANSGAMQPKKKQSNASQNANSSPQNPPQNGDDLEAVDRNTGKTVIDGVNNFAAGFKITAGLGIAFFVLIVLIWMLIPTSSGYTRAQLLWFTLIGQTKLTTDSNIVRDDGSQTVESSIVEQTSLQQQQPTQEIVQSAGPAPSQTNIDLSALEHYEI